MRLIFAAIAASVLLTGAASGETRALSDFRSVDVSGNIEVQIVVGPQYAVEVTGPRVSNIVTRVTGGRLEIETIRHPRRGPGRHALVRVSLPSLQSLDVSAGALVNAREVNADRFGVDVSSGASVELSGSCQTLRVDISSGATLRARGLRCADVQVDASSGANAAVHAENAISVDASSGASLRWAGGARARNIDLSSGGSARPLD